MDNISPLAKTLAESNGIDWRALTGTGAGGQIVEQDIINYLMRVMSGEEEPPATPVDLPPPDWTGDELPAGMSAELLSQAGVESDIAALVNQAPVAQAPAGQGLASHVAPESAASAELEEDEFELDLEDEPSAEPATAAAAMPEPAQPAPAPAAGGLGGLLSQLYQSPTVPAATAPAAAPLGAAAAQYGVASASGTYSSQVSAEHTADTYAPASSTPAEFGQPAASAEPVQAEPVNTAADYAEPAYAQAEATQPSSSDAPPFTDHASADHAAEIQATENQATEDHAAEQSVAVPVSSAPQDVPAPAEQTLVQAPAAVGTVTTAPTERPERAVWFGVYLRRDADLQSASSLREQLNDALGQDVPLSLLVARAAQRHAGLLGLNEVAIQDVYSQRARSVGAAGSSLRDAVSALDSDHDGQADLLVVNAGTLGLDEVHYPGAVTLSLGRVVDGHAALSLNGNVDTAQAAEFLTAVAASLEVPVALII